MFKFLKDRFSKIKQALSKTTAAVSGRILSLFKDPWDENTFDALEQILYEADLGLECTAYLVEQTKSFLRKNPKASTEDILAFLHDKSLAILQTPSKTPPPVPATAPQVILVVGVNGSGKTTSIAKLSNYFKQQGQSVLLAAGDTFRAAAIEQLTTWAERLQIPIIKSVKGQDPAAVAFDAVEAAKARKIDTVIIDTAGRLQNKTDLMRELEKIYRVIRKSLPDAPHQILLVLDATTGQNALDQAEVFHSFTPLTGIILAKLDGSAKGGIALSIYKKLGIPIQWIGVGEQMEDLLPFEKEAYVESLFKA